MASNSESRFFMALTNTDPPLDFCYLTRAPWRAQQTQLHTTEKLRFRLPSDGHLTPTYPISPLFSEMHQYSSTMRQPVSIFMVGIGLRAQLAHQSSWIPRVLIQARPRAVAAHASHMRTHYQPVFSTPISSAQYECRVERHESVHTLIGFLFPPLNMSVEMYYGPTR